MRHQNRQGDVYITQIDKLPEGLKAHKKDKGDFILAYGEVTGHAHRISDTKDMDMFIDENDVLNLRTSAPKELTHEEHDTITIPDGLSKITIQREYFPEGIRNVLD